MGGLVPRPGRQPGEHIVVYLSEPAVWGHDKLIDVARSGRLIGGS
jgi:hypothetical protein